MSAVRAVVQTGTFYHGTSGYPVRVTLGIPLSAGDLEGIDIVLIKPNGARITRVDSGVVVDDVAGVFDFIPQAGDLSMAGEYVFSVLVKKTGARRLATEGAFLVA